MRRNGDADLSGCRQIDYHLKFCRLLDRQFARLGAFENLATYTAARRDKSVMLVA
jgi:hypothetical protein